jgi:hypothetical protein
MGADGCGGIRGAQGDKKTRQEEAKNGGAGYFKVIMAGEISPDMMFCRFCQKWQKMSVYV